MATTEEIRADLAEIVNEVAGIPVEDVQLDKSFVDDLDVDSLSMVEVVVAAEEKFGVSIPDDEVKNLKTVGDAVVVHRERPGLTSRRSPRRPPRDAVPSAPRHLTRSHMPHKSASVSSSPAWGPPPRSVAMSRPPGTPWSRASPASVTSTTSGRPRPPVKIAGRIAVEPTEVLERVKARRLDRSVAVRDGRGDGGLGRLRARRGRHRPRPARRRDGVRHRRRDHAAGQLRHAAREGPAAGLAARRTDADAERAGRATSACTSAPAPR